MHSHIHTHAHTCMYSRHTSNLATITEVTIVDYDNRLKILLITLI